MNIYKICIKGVEYTIRDKEAQTAIEELVKEVEELKANQGKITLIDID